MGVRRRLDWGRGSALCFFFSSRRRHTRLQGDWSSDVCSSDLVSDCAAHIVLLQAGTKIPRFARDDKAAKRTPSISSFAVVIFPQRTRAHPVRGKDRSPPGQNNSALRTYFLPP